MPAKSTKPAKAKPRVKYALWREDKGSYYLNKRDLDRRSLQTADPKTAARLVEEELKRVGAEKERLDKLENGRMLWPHAVMTYHDQIGEKVLRAATLTRYMVSFGQVHPWLGKLHLDEITPQTLVRMADDRRKAGVSNATINRDLTAVSRVLACGVSWGVCASNPASAFDRRLLTSEAREQRTIPTDVEVQKVAARCRGLFGMAVLFARRVGARQEEIFSLLWSQVDLEQRLIEFSHTKTSKRVGHGRTIELTDEDVAFLRDMPRPPKGDFVFWHRDGQRFAEPASYFSEIRRLVSAGDQTVRAFTFHDLRHAYAVSELRRGRDIYDLARHMGHARVSTTEGYLGYVPGGKPITRRPNVPPFVPPKGPATPV